MSKTPVVTPGEANVSVASHFSKRPVIGTEAFTLNLIVLSTGVTSKTGTCARHKGGIAAITTRHKTNNRMQKFGRPMPALSTGKPPGAPLIVRSDEWDAASSPLPAVLNEFYKKGCQENKSPSTGGREDCRLEIQPTDCKCPSISLEGDVTPRPIPYIGTTAKRVPCVFPAKKWGFQQVSYFVGVAESPKFEHLA